MVLVHTICIKILKYDTKLILDVNIFGLRQHLNIDAVENKAKQDEIYAEAKEALHNMEIKENEEGNIPQDRHQYLLDMKDRRDYSKVTLDRYLIGDENYKVPRTQDFDPRFTFGIIFDDITKKIQEKKSVDGLELSYFHWADWMDLSGINKKLYSKEKDSCSSFDMTINNPKNRRAAQEFYKPGKFCIDDDKIDDYLKNDILMELKSTLEEIKKAPLSSGFHIFNYPGRSSSKLKKLAAQSYLNDFMPPPYAILFLLPDSSNEITAKKNILKLNINQEVSNRKRLIETDLVANYTKKRNINNENKVVLDVASEIDDITKAIKLHKPSVGNIPYSKVLNEDEFLERSEEIMAEIEKSADLSLLDKKYLESMRFSKDISSPPKYFFEARLINHEKSYALGAHYDWRFFKGLINKSERQAPALFGLIKAWLAFTNANDFDTWVAHGTLLSWYWSGMSFPWDTDIDVQMPIGQLHRLAREFNQSIIVDLGNGNGEELRYGRYFLDISTFIDRRTRGNGNNNIDARFIDMDTGLYIDITGLAVSDTLAPLEYRKPGVSNNEMMAHGPKESNMMNKLYNCKNSHFALLSDLSPLKLTSYEGELAYIPNDFQKLLVKEYGEKGIQKEVFQEYTFLKKLRIWVLRRVINSFKNRKKKEDSERFGNISVEDFSAKDYAEILRDNKDLYYEYLLTSNYTSFHEDEIYKLTRNEDTSILFKQNPSVFLSSLRHDSFTFNHLSKGYAFEDQILKVLQLEKEFDESN